jgi:beta-mannosidase
MADAAPDELAGPDQCEALEPIPAEVPGTVAGALEAAGRGAELSDRHRLDGRDWWFWTAFESPATGGDEELWLWLDGLATLAEVYLNGEPVLRSQSMFERHRVPLAGGTRYELAIACRALAPRLAERRRPRARWRTRLVDEPNLRFWRTMLLGRAPGFAPGPAVVGPWRPIVIERRPAGVGEVRLRARRRQGVARLDLRAAVPSGDYELRIEGPGVQDTSPCRADAGRLEVEWRGGEVKAWWPHTHGIPNLYSVNLIRPDTPGWSLDCGRVGFRDLESAEDLEQDGPALRVNGVPVFARGAVWTPVDLLRPHAPREQLAEVLRKVAAAGMNMLRVPGIGCYESPEFHDLCDELGILVWQDFMFANLDYPDSDEGFLETVRREAAQVVDELAHRPSPTVFCGGSEVAQQVAMMGLPPALSEGPLYGDVLPRAVAEAGVDATYLPSTPWGGELPFRTDRGVANYYGVGAYLRPLTDARLAGVRFAGESLAFANVPDQGALAELDTGGEPVIHHPEWKRGVPRDAGAGWDFEDVRDHYLAELFGLDPVALRYVDTERYLELSRQVSGEVMAEVFGEWRRAGSPCRGGLVLWLGDLQPGAGWGVLDHRREPKVAFHHLRRALAPVAVWSTDEGLGGVDVHVANDRSKSLPARLRVALYRDRELLVEQAESDIEMAPHETCRWGVEALLGRFVDASWSYRFGPPGHDLIVCSLEAADGPEGDQRALLSQSWRFVGGRPERRETAEQLGLTGRLRAMEGGSLLTLSARRLVYGVRVNIPGHVPEDDAFCLEPGHERMLRLRAVDPEADLGGASVQALNLSGRLRLQTGH